MLETVSSVPSSRALRPRAGIDGGKEAKVARQGLKEPFAPSSAMGPARQPRRLRASARVAALGLAALLVVAGRGAAQDSSVLALHPDTEAPAAPPRPAAAHEALSSAIELQRQGEFEKAAAQLKEADAQKIALSATERQELARLLVANAHARQTRKQGHDLLVQVERALRDGQNARSRELLRKLGALESMLAAADKRRLERVRRDLGVSPPGTADSAALPQARDKMEQARTLLGQGDIEGAERMARAAGALNANFGTRGDSPARILEEVAQTRREPKKLLAASRAALKHGDLDRAEQLALAADKISSTFTFPLWGDTPTKVRREIQAARARKEAPLLDEREASADRKPAEKKASGGMLQSVRNLFGGKPKEEKTDADTTPERTAPEARSKPRTGAGRDNVPAGLTVTAQKLEPSTDAAPTPDAPKDMAAAQTADATPAAAQAKRSTTVVANTEAARRLIEQGRQALAQGKLDLAGRCADQANARKPDLNHYEDNPARLKRDIQRAQARRAAQKSTGQKITTVAKKDVESVPPARVQPTGISVPQAPKTQAEATAMLKTGRKLLADGKLDEAATLGQRIKAFDGHYGLFDDSPDKLLTDVKKIRTARDRAESVTVLKEARKLYQEGEFDKATNLAYKAQRLHGPYYLWELGDRPSKLLADIQTARSKKQSARKTDTAVAQKSDKKPEKKIDTRTDPTRVAHADAKQPAAGGPAEVKRVSQPAPATKQSAQQLIVEALALQKQGKLLEARQKLVAAQALKANFTLDETAPEQVLLQLAALAQQQTDATVQRAMDVAYYGKSAPLVNYQQAEQLLRQASQLAQGFGHDLAPIDQKLKLIVDLRVRLPGGAALAAGPREGQPGTASATDSGIPAGAAPHGLELLEKSRLELRKGQTILARRLAEEAYTGAYGVKELARMRLGEIDREEFNQRRMTKRREFDAAQAAFNRGDFFLAREILVNIRAGDLDPGRQGRLRELVAHPQMGSDVQLTRGTQSPALPGAPTPVIASAPSAGMAQASDIVVDDPVADLKRMQTIKFNELRVQSQQVQTEALDRFRTGDMTGAIDMLRDFLTRLPESQLDRQKLAALSGPVQSRIQKYEVLMAQAERDNLVKGSQKTVAQVASERNAVDRTRKKNVSEKMKEFVKAYRAADYKRALAAAQIAAELDPDNDVAIAAVTMARTMGRKREYAAGKANRENFTYKEYREQGNYGPHVSPDNPLVVDPERSARAHNRGPGFIERTPVKSEKVRAIESKLDEPVNLNFNNAPLRKVIDDLRAWKAINIHPEYGVLEKEGISLERPVTINLEQVSLKSALNLLLSQLDLTWVIRDEALVITTKENARGKLVQRTYQVADLVVPINNYETPDVMDFQKQLEHTQNQQGLVQAQSSGGSPPGGRGLPGGTVTGSPGGSQSDGGTPFNAGGGKWSTTMTTASNSMQQELIKLITSAVAPNSWSVNGGQGTIDYFPLGMTLIINQTLDIQEQIADLLQALRRLQDQEVAIELRLITIADAFYERLGVDLQFNVRTNTTRFQPQLTTQQFSPLPFLNNFTPDRFIAGLTPAGTFTSDLNIPIHQNSFAMTVPPFGGFPNTPGANGGLSLGLAFLSDIQVFLFMEAAQGDQRTNVMQAPKLTMFNGQSAQLSVQNQQFFVTQVQAIQNGGQILFLPQNQDFAQGVQLNLQPVISGDRRFVRINFARIQITNLASAIVPLFPIVSTIQPFFEGIGNVGNPVLFTQFIQQPVFSTVNVQTTVVVPDGGTVLLGGLKRLSEGRNEFGPPILSKIPYINRLFKNVGYGREAESILLMVTPRIIINEEEEILQTGVISNPALVQDQRQ